ncbi:MAG: hypothetical protein AAF560_23360, partial [Acidobacteriota bacterium]
MFESDGVTVIAELTEESSSVELPPGRWEISTPSPDWWLRPLEVEASESSGLLKLKAWPAGWVEGAVRVSRGHELPAALDVRFGPSPEATLTPPESVEVCPVAEGRFSCKLPATSLDLKLYAAGFIPSYLW